MASTRAVRALLKLPISGLSTVSAAMGYVAFAGGVDVRAIPVCGGVLLLACAAAALNEIQERDRDALMTRTRHRPLPSGEMTVGGARAVVVGAAAGGLALLLLSSGILAACLGGLAMLWYNGVYTPMKRSSRFAVLPGSVLGALPPAIGWVGAGGAHDARVLALGSFLFMWQLPHFLLLLVRLAPDYRRAGFPTLTTMLSPTQLARLTFACMAVAAMSALLIPLCAVTRSSVAGALIAAAGVVLLLLARSILSGDAAAWRRAFHTINAYALAVMVVVIADALV